MQAEYRADMQMREEGEDELEEPEESAVFEINPKKGRIKMHGLGF